MPSKSVNPQPFFNDSNAQSQPDGPGQTHRYATMNMYHRKTRLDMWTMPRWARCKILATPQTTTVWNAGTVKQPPRGSRYLKNTLHSNTAFHQVLNSFHHEVLDGPKHPFAQRTHVKLSRRKCVKRWVCAMGRSPHIQLTPQGMRRLDHKFGTAKHSVDTNDARIT